MSHTKGKRGFLLINNKKGQLTLFIIIALLIIVGILAYFLYAQPDFLSEQTGNLGFEGCVEDAVNTAIDELARKGGYAQPEFTYTYQGQEYTYLCYTANYYKTCVVQQPFIGKNFEDQLERSVKGSIDQCYTSSIADLNAQGYNVVTGTVTQNIHFEPGIVRVEIDAPTTVGNSNYRKFNILINHPLYEMTGIATSIIQSEAAYGDVETTDFLLLYPDYKIQKWKQSDGTTLYTIQNKLFNTQLQFASRSLAWPPGYISAA